MYVPDTESAKFIHVNYVYEIVEIAHLEACTSSAPLSIIRSTKNVMFGRKYCHRLFYDKKKK